MTGLAGTAWLLYSNITGNPISFFNATIQFQIPFLIIVVIAKLILLAKNKFKTKKSLFYSNLYVYSTYIIVVLVIDLALKNQ